MKDDLKGKSSGELKQMLLNTSGESGDSETKEVTEPQDFELSSVDEEQTDRESQEATEESRQRTLAYVEQISGGDLEGFGKKMDTAMEADFLDLRDKYEPVKDLVDKFGREFARGKIKVDLKDFEDSDNIDEQIFLRWISKPKVMRELDVSQIKTIIEIGANGPPLRSRSKEVFAPTMMHPRRKFKG